MNQNIKTVEAVIAPPAPHYVGDGFRVHNFIPGHFKLSMQRMSPFLILDYNSKFEFPAAKKPKGVGVHPHRGFETVTIAYEGAVAHGDSYGNRGVIHKGDVQWMTAASGVLHKEYHEENFSKKGGWFQMVQLWVNLPAKDKMSTPRYQDIKNTAIPKMSVGKDGSHIEIIAGDYFGEKGIAQTFTPVYLMNAKLKKGTSAPFRFPSNYNTAIIAIEGSALVNGTDQLPLDHFALMHNDGTDFEITAAEDSLFLVMSGEPIDEPIAAHGPFVMNTHQEIIEAFQDFNLGKFGYLEEEQD